MHKVITGILVCLVIIGGYFTYTLNQQINVLSDQLTVLQKEQAARSGALSNELTAFRGETLNKIGILGEEIKEIDETITEINAWQDELQDEIGGVATELSKSVMDTGKIYQRASQAVVRISDGKRTVGSGFVFDDKGHVVTASHVIDGVLLTKIEVILPDGSISRATVANRCQWSDVAVLKLKDAPTVKPLTLAESATMTVGEPVVTIGNPFDLTETLTVGVVSQLDRCREFGYDSKTREVANLIQFDAPVNPGSSGGPLFNSEGEVIGLVIGIHLIGAEGINYAVSANKVKRVATALIDKGSFDYPRLGVEIADVWPQIARDKGLETINGAIVMDVLLRSPAADAGIEVGDIIVAIDGKAVGDVGDLRSYLGEHKSPGEEATLTLMRDKAKVELSLKIGKR